MNVTDLDHDEPLRRAAAELHHAGPNPIPWDHVTARPSQTEPPPPSSRSPLLVAASLVLIVGAVVAIVAVSARNVGPHAEPAPSDREDRTPSEPIDEPTPSPRDPVVVRPELAPGADAIAVTADPTAWVGRWLWPASTPAGFSVDHAAIDPEGSERSVQFVPIDSAEAAAGGSIRVSTVHGRLADDAKLRVDDANGTEWGIHFSERSGRLPTAQAATTSRDWFGIVDVTSAELTEANHVDLVTEIIDELQLVAADDLPIDVVDLASIETVAIDPDTQGEAVEMRAARATNSWCITTSFGFGSSYGCGRRFDPATQTAILTAVTYDDRGDVMLSGMTSADVVRVELVVSGLPTIEVVPDDRSGRFDARFWIRRLQIGAAIDELDDDESPFIEGRAYDVDGRLIATFDELD